jgi:hypothetical protein
MARMLLHIGPMKTGSTAIQAALGEHRNALREQGILVLRPLNASFLHGVIVQQLKQKQLSPSQQRKLTRIRENLADVKAGDHTVILSAELLGQGLRDEEAVAALIELLRQACPRPLERLEVVCYLRRQDELSVSMASSRLRLGHIHIPCEGKPFNYAVMLNAWERVLGRQAVQPRRYDPSSWEAGDVVADFAAVLGVPYSMLRLSGHRVRNSSLNPQAQALLGHLALALREKPGCENPQDLPGWSTLTRYLDSSHSGNGPQPSRAKVERFMASIQSENESVARHWFGDDLPLFSGDYSRYPVEESPNVDDKAVLDAAVASLVKLLQFSPSS